MPNSNFEQKYPLQPLEWKEETNLKLFCHYIPFVCYMDKQLYKNRSPQLYRRTYLNRLHHNFQNDCWHCFYQIQKWHLLIAILPHASQYLIQQVAK